MGLEPQPEWRTLLEVISLLDRENIPYMLTGSIANTFYATPRMTRDIDIVIELELKNVEKIVKAFETDFYIDKVVVEESVRNSSMFNVLHNRFQVKVDFIIRKNEEYRRTEFARRRSFTLQGKTACVVSPEDLIISKLFWAKDSLSEQQLSDVRDLLQSVKNLDREYVTKWVTTLGLQPMWAMVQK